MKHLQGKNGKFACDCCGYFTLATDKEGSYQVCSVCFWEDDALQAADPDYEGGANTISLNKAKANYRQLGAMDMRSTEYVRDPLESEKA